MDFRLRDVSQEDAPGSDLHNERVQWSLSGHACSEGLGGTITEEYQTLFLGGLLPAPRWRGAYGSVFQGPRPGRKGQNCDCCPH